MVLNIVDTIHAVLSDLNIGESDRQWVIDQYSSPERRYHNLAHIERMLTTLKTNHLGLYNDPFVAYAVIMHDVIYLAGAKDNEAQSTEKALELIRNYKDIDGEPISEDTLNLVAAIIMETTHKTKCRCNDVPQNIVSDIDLIGLAYPWENFVKTGIAIREEFSHVSERDFTSGRVRFFLDMLNKPCIFQTDHYYDLYEAAARQNMTKWIQLTVDELLEYRG